MSDYMQGNPDTGAVSVPFSDDEAEAKSEQLSLLEDDKPDESPEARKTRKQKQQERLQGLLQKGRDWEEKAKKLEEKDAQRERELAELRGMLAERRAQEQQQRRPGQDPFEAELDAVYRRQQEAYNSAQAEIKAGTFNESRQKHYEQVAREIETDKGKILVRQQLAATEPQRRAEQGQQRFINKYPDIYGNPRAYEFAEATFKRRRALDPNAPVTDDLVDEIMQETRATLKIGPKTAPTASEKARLSGVPSSGGGGSGGGGSGALQLDPTLRKIAIAAHPELSEAEALKAWANKTGKRMREKKLL